MNEKAKKRIAEAIENKSTSLNLGFCELTEVPKEISELVWLEYLDLSSNKISKIEKLDKLIKLKNLRVNNNNLHKIDGLNKLSDLEELLLSNNNLTYVENLDFLKRLKTLSIANNKLEKINGLDNLSNLMILRLYNNSITEISNLENLQKLETLRLEQNRINKIQGLDSLNSLIRLDLDNNQLTQIQGLDNLMNLQELYLNNNQLTQIQGLDKLTNLQTLSLSNNELTKIEGIINLGNLKALFIENCKLSEISNLNNLIKLETLSFHKNVLTEIKNLKSLVNLKSLNISNNYLPEIKGLESLINLEILFLNNNEIIEIKGNEYTDSLKVLALRNNRIEQISNINQFKSIPVIDLSQNLIEDLSPFTSLILDNQPVLWEEFKMKHEDEKDKGFINFKINNQKRFVKKGIYVKNCHNLKQPSPEWVMLGPEVIRSYFQAIHEQGAAELYEVKVLLIGDGGTGKTSLAYRLTKPKEDLPTTEERTRGIDIYDWKYTKDKKKHLVHLWDFGGQVMYDMVHQYFYSQRSLYILLDSSRNGANENDSRLNQLLQSAELFGRESPMVMIQNEHSDHKKQMDFAVLQKHYPFLKEYKSVNLQTQVNFKEVIHMLKTHISKIPGLGVVLPKKWLKIRNEISRLQKRKSVIEVDKFRKICAKYEIVDEKAQDLLSSYFHQLGVFLHFQKKNRIALRRKIILNREWATKASYKVFDADFMTKRTTKGGFSVDDLDEFWTEPEFRNYHAELLELMQEFEICFKLESLDNYLVPRMMDKMPDASYCNTEERPLHFYYEYTFMPEGLLNRLSVRLHDRIKGDDNQKCVWNDGVVFEKKGTDLIAELREIKAPDKKRIDIRVIGTDAHWMSEYIIDEIDKINENFNLERLKVVTKISCICKECQKTKEGEEPFFFDFRKVKADLQKPETKFHSNLCDKSREKVDYHDLLKTISHKALEEVEEIQKSKKIGRFGEEVIFRGEKSVKIAQQMLDRQESKLASNVENLGKQLTTESTKTREAVKKEHDKTRETIHQYLKDMPQTFKAQLQKSEKNILNGTFKKMDSLALDIENTNDLIEIVGKGIDRNFMQDMYNTELLEAFTLKQEHVKYEIKDKLKVSLWLIPLLLKYEKELSTNFYQDLKNRWKEGGFKALFVE